MSKAAELAEFGGGISGGTDAVSGVAKAWVSFNGSGTLAVRNSFNNASVTDNGTGDYSPAFTNNMADDNYVVGGLGQRDSTYSAGSYAIDISIKSATSHSTYITSSNFTIISM